MCETKPPGQVEIVPNTNTTTTFLKFYYLQWYKVSANSGRVTRMAMATGKIPYLGSFHSKSRISVCCQWFPQALCDTELPGWGVSSWQQGHGHCTDSSGPNLICTSVPHWLLALFFFQHRGSTIPQGNLFQCFFTFFSGKLFPHIRLILTKLEACYSSAWFVNKICVFTQS